MVASSAATYSEYPLTYNSCLVVYQNDAPLHGVVFVARGLDQLVRVDVAGVQLGDDLAEDLGREVVHDLDVGLAVGVV